MNPLDEIAGLRAEVAALRGRVRTLFAVLVVGLGATALLALYPRRGRGGWAAEEARAVQVEAQEYRLLDPDGNLRGLWHCPPAGPALTLLDAEGRVAVDLRQTPDGGALRVNDAGLRNRFKRP
jgi:hypothetical protein